MRLAGQWWTSLALCYEAGGPSIAVWGSSSRPFSLERDVMCTPALEFAAAVQLRYSARGAVGSCTARPQQHTIPRWNIYEGFEDVCRHPRLRSSSECGMKLRCTHKSCTMHEDSALATASMPLFSKDLGDGCGAEQQRY